MPHRFPRRPDAERKEAARGPSWAQKRARQIAIKQKIERAAWRESPEAEALLEGVRHAREKATRNPPQ